jgi:hypothetical protein
MHAISSKDEAFGNGVIAIIITSRAGDLKGSTAADRAAG